MGTLFAIHVRAPESATLAGRLAHHGRLLADVPSEFATVELSRYDGPTEDDLAELAGLSTELKTDILWLGYSSVSEAFRYHHWRSGRPVRALAFGWFGSEGVWDFAEGDPEPWERAAFFHWSALENMPRPADEAERAELRHMLDRGEVRAGLTFPSVDARVSARIVGEHFGLLGWV